ncbi:MAG: NHL repeat containing protein [Bacteroidetes bacterium]|nr:MAG: NHL repeat containing protein [Bacteroidota bacterium]
MNVRLILSWLFLTICIHLSAQTLENRILSYTNRCIDESDIDGDGDLDLLSAGLNNLQWHENTGNALFRNYLITPNYNDVRAVKACDIDDDGDVDVLVSSFTNNRILWQRNNGNEIFDEVILTNSAGGTEFIEVADIDNDGDTDILGAAFNSDVVYLLTNDGNENFIYSVVATGLDGAISVRPGDLDNDGDIDIVAASFNNNTIIWIENTGSGSYSSHTLTTSQNGPVSVLITDFDEDNDPDIVYTSNGGYGWFNNTNGSFTQIALTTGGTIREIRVVDLDGDGHKDLLLTDYDEDDILWRHNNGNLTFGYNTVIDFSVDYASMLVTGDFNGDGYTDVISGSSFDLKFHSNNATQSFINQRIDRYLDTAASSCAGDFDNDGDTDLMAAGYLRLSFIRNDGNGLFTTSHVMPTNLSMACIDIHAADMDGDGDTDAVFTGDAYGFPGISWIENLGGGNFDRLVVYGLSDAQGVFPVDFDSDGDMDVVASTNDGSYVHWYENDGNEDFTQHLISGSYWYPMDVAALDYDEDGLMDVVAAYSGNSDKIVLHHNTGAGFSDWTINSSAPGASSVAIKDMDLDGDTDILSSSSGDNKIAWYENPNFNQHVITTNAYGAIHVDAGDFDGDGDIDVTSASPGDDKICWYQNAGNMSFTKITLTDKLPDPTSVSTGDINGDGMDEIFSTCKTTYAVAMYGVPQAGPPIMLADCDELFISEYIEGSAYNKAIEVFNPTTETINLDDYEISVYQNGSLFPTQTVGLTGSIAPMGVHVVAHGSSSPGILALADQTFGFGFNGNDAVVLLHNGDIIDILGKIGYDPGTQWISGGVSTLDMTMIRKSGISKGSNTNPVSFDPALQWNALPLDNISNLGSHTSICASYCPPSVSITASANPSCSGAPVTFTASPVNQGTSPVFQWKKNGIAAGTNSPIYTTSDLTNNDVILCEMTSSEACAITPLVISNSITISVNQSVTPSVTISTPANSFCQGTQVTFTAVPVNGGTNPIFQWKVNGNPSGTGAYTFTTSTLNNNDVVTCVITSSITCLTAPTATSNPVTVYVTSNVTPSVTISSNQTTLCAGSPVTFTAYPVNGGSNPAFQWRLNGNPVYGATSATYTTSSLANNDIVSCQITSNAPCLVTPSAVSSGISVTVLPTVPASVSITASQTSTCSGETITFTAIPLNGGTNPAYQWMKNGNIINGATGPVFIVNNLVNNDVITCSMTSNASCPVPAVAISNAIMISVSSPVTPAITITASQTTICTGTTVTFTANPVNGGTNPTFQWYKNGNQVSGATQMVYITNELNNNDQISCAMVSNAACITTPNATSNTLTITISTGVTPTVVISADQNPACHNTPVTFTAVPANGGSSPQWQWFKNNNLINGALSAVYTTDLLESGDAIHCEMTSNADCLITPYAISNTVIMTIETGVIPAVTIFADPITACEGTMITFTAIPVNGGPYPLWQWKKNGEDISGANGPVYSSTDLISGDMITCEMISGGICVTTPYATSNTLTMDFYPNPEPVAWADGVLLSTTNPFAAYQWMLEGNNINGATYQQYNAVENGSYSVEVTDENGCRGISNEVDILIISIPSIVSGQTLFIRPNPTNGNFNLDTEMHEPVRADVSVYNSHGMLIYSGETDFPKGKYSLPFSLLRPVPGIYFMKISVEQTIHLLKFVVI